MIGRQVQGNLYLDETHELLFAIFEKAQYFYAI